MDDLYWLEDSVREEKNEDKQSRMQEAWDVLKILNISEEDQSLFLQKLIDKYEQQFTQDLAFTLYIKQTFALEENDLHALKLSYFGLEKLLKKTGIQASQVGLFTPSAINSQVEQQDSLRAIAFSRSDP